MDYLIGIILALVGGLLYFKGKADKAAAGSKIANTKGRDQELSERQEEIEKAIQELDAGIKKMKENKEKQHKYRSLKERAEEAKNRYKK